MMIHVLYVQYDKYMYVYFELWYIYIYIHTLLKYIHIIYICYNMYKYIYIYVCMYVCVYIYPLRDTCVDKGCDAGVPGWEIKSVVNAGSHDDWPRVAASAWSLCSHFGQALDIEFHAGSIRELHQGQFQPWPRNQWVKAVVKAAPQVSASERQRGTARNAAEILVTLFVFVQGMECHGVEASPLSSPMSQNKTS